MILPIRHKENERRVREITLRPGESVIVRCRRHRRG